MNILSLNSDFNKYFSQINFKFSLPQRKHLSTFAEGLLSSDGKKSILEIDESARKLKKERSMSFRFQKL